MMKKLSIFSVLLTLAVFLAAGNAQALPKIDDGIFNLTEWAGYYVNDDGVKTHNGHSGYVDPGWGGQAYDVEYLGLIITDDSVYFGLQTGFDLVSGHGSYQPGDFALDIDNNGSWDYAIDFSISGDDVNYTLVDMTSAPSLNWGSKDYGWESAEWFSQSNPWQARYNYNSSNIRTFNGAYGSGVFSNNSDGGTSYVIEGKFERSWLGDYSGGPMKIHWTMECGNDAGDLTSAPVPEPTTILLSGIGLLGMGFYLRRKTRPSIKIKTVRSE